MQAGSRTARSEVLVIGAGAAGLEAARSLSAEGVRVCIVEGRNRIGGRIYTVRDADSPVPIELGAEFIHGRPPEVLTLARKAGLTTRPMSDDHRSLRSGRATRDTHFEQVDDIMERLGDPELPDQTFAEFVKSIGADAGAARLATAYVEGFNAARAELISTRALGQEMRAAHAIDGDHAYRFPAGYDRLTEWLGRESRRQSAELHLDTVVSEVKWRRGQVEVTAQSASDGSPASFAAARVVVTVPLAVLQAPEGEPATIRFTPPLPAIRRAVDRLAMGEAARVVLRLSGAFRENHPELPAAGFIHSDDEGLPTWWTGLEAPSSGDPAPGLLLTGWAGGPKAERICALSDQDAAEAGIRSLERILGARQGSVAAQVESWHLHNWTRDPFSRGAYSYALVGGPEARRVLAEAVEDTLYFAGEATEAEGHSATVHGALSSGRRAARQILQAKSHK